MKCWRGKKKLQGTKTKNNEERIPSSWRSGRTDRMNPWHWNGHRALPEAEEHNAEAMEYHCALPGKTPGTRLRRSGYTNCGMPQSLPSTRSVFAIYLLYYATCIQTAYREDVWTCNARMALTSVALKWNHLYSPPGNNPPFYFSNAHLICYLVSTQTGIHLFIQQKFTGCLLCVGYCFKQWGYCSGGGK